MASIPGAGLQREPRSAGGKMVRPRRAMLRKAPYDRPRLLNSTQQNPNWISRRIFSPTRTIVTGAGRILSSVFGFESSSSSSSSSACDSFPDDTDDNNDGQDVSSQGVHTIEHHVGILDTSDDYNDLRGCFSCFFVGHQREPQSFAGKNETKRLIEQLLMQETFSREECDKLTNIIKSRVVNSPMLRGMGVVRPNETPKRKGGSDVEVDDLCSAAVMEARKWLEEKKSGSNSKLELHHGTSPLNPVSLTHATEVEAGSPVDMAKSYMRTRPPWASPSTNNIEFGSPSPIGLPLFKEETRDLIGGSSLSSSKLKRGSPATGSWNIQDEIRKVRSKATEEMLRTLSSSKIDWSSFSLQHKSDPGLLVANNLGPADEDNPRSPKKSVDASVDMAARPVSQTPRDALCNHALPSPAILGCEQNQGMEAFQSIEGRRDEMLDMGQRLQSTGDIKTSSHSDVAGADVDLLKDCNGSIQPFSSSREGTVLDKNRSTLNEVAGIGVAASAANGFPSSGSSMSAEPDKEQNHRPINEEDNTAGSGHDNKKRAAAEENCVFLSEASIEVAMINEDDAHDRPINEEDNTVGSGHDNKKRAAAEENCVFLSEASIEVAMVNEDDAVVSGSKNSSSMEYVGSPQHLDTLNSERSLAGKSDDGIEKQQGKKVSRYNRRGKGRRR